MQRNFFNRLIQFSVLFFSRVTILSGSLLRLLKLDEKKCTVLPLGAEHFECNRDFSRMHLFYLGTLTKRNIHQTVKGFARFYRQHVGGVEMSYDIVGFGPEKDKLQLVNTISDEKLEGVVVFHGRKHHDKLRPFLTKCNIGISYVPMTPFFDRQPPTKTFEYVLAGMICIATSTAENKLLITKNNGVLCDSNEESFFEALNQVFHNRHLYNSQKVVSTLESHSWSQIVKNILFPSTCHKP